MYILQYTGTLYILYIELVAYDKKLEKKNPNILSLVLLTSLEWRFQGI